MLLLSLDDFLNPNRIIIGSCFSVEVELFSVVFFFLHKLASVPQFNYSVKEDFLLTTNHKVDIIYSTIFQF